MSIAFNPALAPARVLSAPPHAAARAAAAPTRAQPARPTKPLPFATAWGPAVHRYLTVMKNGGAQRASEDLVTALVGKIKLMRQKSKGGYEAAVSDDSIKMFNLVIDACLFKMAVGSGKFQALPMSIDPQIISLLRKGASDLHKSGRTKGGALLAKTATKLESANSGAKVMAKVADLVLRNQKTAASNRLAAVLAKEDPNGRTPVTIGYGLDQFLVGPDGWLARDLANLK
jgi:hypothetical protein